MAASKTTKKRKRKPAAKQKPVGNRFQTEILILVMFAACLILMFSAFGMGGIGGNAISALPTKRYWRAWYFLCSSAAFFS